MNALTPHPTIRSSAADAAAELGRFGSTVLRDAWRADHLAALRSTIAGHLKQRAQWAAQGTLNPRLKMLHSHGAGTIAQVADFDPGLLAEMFQGSLYHEICVAFLEDDVFYVSLDRLAFRRHDPKGPARTLVPFHQDSGTQHDAVANVLNCWIPLDPGCGRTAPGLEVVRELVAPDFPRRDFGLQSVNAVYDPITIDADVVMARFSDKLLAPEFDLGDGLVFSQDVIHRTYVTSQMTQPRLNFEFRVFSARGLVRGASLSDVGDAVFRVA